MTRARPTFADKSRLISLLGSSLKQSGFMPGQDRQMIQGVYRRHLSIMVLSNFPEHLGEIVGLLLILTECHAVETCLWFDVIDALLAQHKKVDSRYSNLLNFYAALYCEGVVSQKALRRRVRDIMSHFFQSSRNRSV